MKNTVVLCTFLFACYSGAGQQSGSTNTLEYIVSSIGLDYRQVTRIESIADPLGDVQVVTNSYFELATGMHRIQAGNLVQASTDIEIDPLDGAVAQLTRHQVSLAGVVGDLQGAIRLHTPDGKELISTPLGISYYDTASGQCVLIAELKPEVSGILYPPDVVVYPNCFTDFGADLEYKNRLCGFEQNLVFQEQPPAPSEYGLNNETTVIQLLTEFFAPPVAVKRSVVKDGLNDDAIVDFGEMKIVRGKSFMAGDKSKSVVVSKQWTVLDGRNFLIEQIPYASIQGYLNTLPLPQQAGLLTPDKVRHVVSAERLLPERKVAAPFRVDEMQIAAVPREDKGFVLDYEIVGTTSDVTFKGDTTYYVSDAAYLSGTNILEGGAVIKFNPEAYSQLVIIDELKCQTAPYRPAFFTSRDDDSVGEIIPGSTGDPMAQYYYPGLGFANFDHEQSVLEYCHFRYSGSPLEYDNYPTTNTVRHCQFVNCAQGVSIIGLFDVHLQNVLMDNVETPFQGSGLISAEHLTIDRANDLAHGADIELHFKNCLFVAVTNLGTGVTLNETNENFVWLTDDPGVFQTVGAGNHYLAASSPYRDAGTNDIDAQLHAELRSKTTYPPTVLTDAITSDTTLDATVERDADDLDLGYHYDALDFAINASVTNATLTLTNGVGVAVFGETSLGLQSGSKLVSIGAPTSLNRVVRYQCVQEQPIFWSGTNVTTINAASSSADVYPSIYCRFTEFVMPSLEPGWDSLVVTTDGGPTNVVCKDSFIWNGAFQLGQGTDRYCSLTFENSLLHRVKGGFSNLYGAANDYELHLWNNLFYGGTWQMENNSAATNWSIHNNAFDGVSLDSFECTSSSHNAYINSSVLDGSSGNDVLLDGFVYATGPLGRFYHGQSDLTGAGSVTADSMGGYHYTTAVDQTKEADSMVDIGFHYVAVDSNGSPIDTDADDLPDYYEDANGNGVTDGNETDWD